MHAKPEMKPDDPVAWSRSRAHLAALTGSDHHGQGWHYSFGETAMYSFGLGLLLWLGPWYYNPEYYETWYTYGTYEGAVAASINTDTAIRLNQYLFLSGEENTQHYRARLHQRQAYLNKMYRARHK